MKIKAIYDNFGKTFDRYTVYYNYKENDGTYFGRGMSNNPYSPNGFGMCISGNLGRHNGKHIKFEDLPKDCQKVINSDLMGV